MNKKLRGLLLQVEVMEGSEIKVLNENTFEVDGAEYLVLTEDEREEEFKAYQESLIEDMGLESFSEWAQDYIIENFVDDEWFMEAMREHFEYYISDINEEPADNEEFENRLQEEISEVNCEDEERMAVFTKKYFLLIIDKNNNLVTAFQSNPRQYKKYLEKFSK